MSQRTLRSMRFFWIVAKIFIGLAMGALIGRYAPMIASYLFIPPAHGYYRYYQDYDLDAHTAYWRYFHIDNLRLGSSTLRKNDVREEWEILWSHGHRRAWLYDDRDEHDGEVKLSRTGMTIRRLDGTTETYPRVLDLWEIWFAKSHARGEERFSSIDARRRVYLARVEERMREAGLTRSPAESARRRPPLEAAASTVTKEEPMPFIAVTEFGAWNNIGTVFVAYEDGRMVCRDARQAQVPTYHTAKTAQLRNALLSEMPREFESFDSRYILSKASDQVVTTVWIRGKFVEVYGPWRDPDIRDESGDTADLPSIRAENEEARALWGTLPESLRSFLKKIDELRASPGEPWIPDQIEVSFLDYEHSVDEPILWPADWPDLYSSSTRKRGSYYTVLLPASEAERLYHFLATRPARGAVLIDLNRMSPTVRYPFPGEAVWLKKNEY